MRKYFFSLVLALGTGIPCLLAQSVEDKKAVEGLMKASEYVPEHHFSVEGKSAEGIIFGGLFYLYKTYISSQDGSHCMFTPSCSQYALEAVRKNGIFMGAVDAFDRLSRCNGLSRELYHKHPTSDLLYDPVQ
jgi:hypothetical protein